MVKIADLRKIAHKRLQDSEVLIRARRYEAAIYLGGYAIEMLFKYNICKLFGFKKGFPENNNDLSIYGRKFTENFKQISSVRKLKTHNLNTLITYSGKESDTLSKSYDEWIEVKKWDPEMRYSNSRFYKKDAELFFRSINKLKNNLLK